MTLSSSLPTTKLKMGAENQVTTSAAVCCGACQTENPAAAKFCKRCGHPLLEPCFSCSSPVLLTQNFCVSCGADLEEALNGKHEQHQQSMTQAVASSKEHDFEHAYHLLNNIAQLKDFRFAEAADNAAKAIEKVNLLRSRSETLAQQNLARGKQAFDDGDHAEVVRLLESIPSRLMSDDAKKILSKVKSYVEEVEALENEARKAVSGKQWSRVGGMVSQLLVLSPENQIYLRLAKQVSEKLVTEAKRLLAEGSYDRASEKLACIPDVVRTQSQQQLGETIKNVCWLSKQVEVEPYATPMLGRIAVRYAKDASDHFNANEAAKELAVELRRSPRPPRMHFPKWKGSSDAWMGGSAGLLGSPSCVKLLDKSTFGANAGRFNNAIGLALQGLGQSRIREQFLPKKGILSSLVRRKNDWCWGIDLGASALKAVCLRKTENGFEIIDSYIKEFSSPVCRRGLDAGALSLVKPVVEAFLAEKKVNEARVWANLAASQLVTRFVRLPPVKNKQVDKLIESEINRKIPIPASDLIVFSSIAKLKKDEVHGRPAMLVAARKSVVERRIKLLETCGLELDGMQADPIALVNLAAYEFLDVWASEAAIGSSDLSSSSQGEPPFSEDQELTPAVALVDCGASATTVTIVSAETQWCWTLDTGGEDCTVLLARQAKTTHDAAEQLKRNPADLKCPSADYTLIEEKLDAMRLRLGAIVSDARKQNARFEIKSSWCMGGGSLTHQWVRRVMCKTPE